MTMHSPLERAPLHQTCAVGSPTAELGRRSFVRRLRHLIEHDRLRFALDCAALTCLLLGIGEKQIAPGLDAAHDLRRKPLPVALAYTLDDFGHLVFGRPEGAQCMAR